MSRTGKDEKKNFVGHITYPYNEQTKELFFQGNVTKKLYIIERDGELIYKLTSKWPVHTGLYDFLRNEGYTVNEKTVSDPGNHQSKRTISIPCKNEDCRHASERYREKCTVYIQASVERIRDKNRKVVEKNIVLSYGARDIRELTAKSECLLWHIKDTLGIEGVADVYGKMELC